MPLSILVPGTGSHTGTGTISIRPLLGALLSIFCPLYVFLLLSCTPPETLSVEVLSVRPHDPAAYTQGLLLHEQMLYESTGRYGESTLRRVDPQTGQILQRVDLPPDIFGEGLAHHNSRLVQLTYRKQIALIYELDGFGTLGQFSYQGQGWGLCHDGQFFIMSNGSAVLTVRDSDTFAVVDQIYVTRDASPVVNLNELECVGNEIYANIYRSDRIVRIARDTGKVLADIDASGLLSITERFSADVLNGIAYDPENETFLITGKLWPKLFEVRFVP